MLPHHLHRRQPFAEASPRALSQIVSSYGFTAYAGTHRLNSRAIPLHASPRYRYTTQWHGTGPYTLHILLHHGQQIAPLGG